MQFPTCQIWRGMRASAIKATLALAALLPASALPATALQPEELHGAGPPDKCKAPADTIVVNEDAERKDVACVRLRADGTAPIDTTGPGIVHELDTDADNCPCLRIDAHKPAHNQTLARLDGRHPAALSGGTCVDGGWNGRLTISGQGPFSTCAEIAHLCDTFR